MGMAAAWREGLDRHYRHAVVAASVAMLVIGSGSTFVLVVALKPIAAEFGWARSVPSLAYSLFFLLSGVGSIGMGWWLDRAGMSRPALIAAVMMGGGAIVASGADGAWQLYFAFGVMMGLLGQSALFSPLVANVTRWFEAGRGAAVGVVASGQSLAGIVWPPIAQLMIEHLGWRDTFFWYGAIAIATMLPVSLVFRRAPPPLAPLVARPGTPVPARPSAPTSGLLALLCVAAIGCCVAMALPLSHVVSHVSDIGHAARAGAQVLATMLAAAFISRAFLFGPLTARLGGLGALLVFSGTQTVMLALLAVVSDLSAIFAVAFGVGLGYGGVIPCYAVIVREYMPAGQVGRRVAVIVLFASWGMALGAWIGGALFDLSGTYGLAFAIGAAFNATNLAIIGWLSWRRRAGLLRPLAA